MSWQSLRLATVWTHSVWQRKLSAVAGTGLHIAAILDPNSNMHNLLLS